MSLAAILAEARADHSVMDTADLLAALDALIEPAPNLLSATWQTPGEGTDNQIASATPEAFGFTVLRQNDNQQAYMRGLHIEAGAAYVLEFSANAAEPARVAVHLHEHDGQRANLGIQDHRLEIGADPEEVRIRFVATGSSNNARLRFMFGIAPGVPAYVDNLRLQKA